MKHRRGIRLGTMQVRRGKDTTKFPESARLSARAGVRSALRNLFKRGVA